MPQPAGKATSCCGPPPLPPLGAGDHLVGSREVLPDPARGEVDDVLAAQDAAGGGVDHRVVDLARALEVEDAPGEAGLVGVLGEEDEAGVAAVAELGHPLGAAEAVGDGRQGHGLAAGALGQRQGAGCAEARAPVVAHGEVGLRGARSR